MHFCLPVILHLFSEAEKQSRMAAVLEKLHAKHNASRPWQETCKVVRQAMVRQTHLSLKENHFNLQSTFFNIQKLVILKDLEKCHERT